MNAIVLFLFLFYGAEILGSLWAEENRTAFLIENLFLTHCGKIDLAIVTSSVILLLNALLTYIEKGERCSFPWCCI